MNDFFVDDFEEFEEELEETFADGALDSRGLSSTSIKDNENFQSVLDLMKIILEKSYGMFDKMMDVLQNFA